MRKAAFRAIAPAVLVCLGLGSAWRGSALDWPVAQRVITGTFGEYRGDHFHNGIDIGGGAQEVHPVLPGEVLFRYEEGSDYTSVPRGVGSFVALQHSQDLVTLYCHLANGSLGAERAEVSPDDTIGVIGDTGHATGPHLHFALYDEQTYSYENPLALLPPVVDRQRPVIKSVLLSVGDTVVPLRADSEIAVGQYALLAELYDPRQDVAYNWPMAPYSIRVSLDGKEIRAIVFDSLQVKDGRTVLGATDLDSVYRSDGLVELGTADLRAGQSRLEVSVRDYAGNEAVFATSFTIH